MENFAPGLRESILALTDALRVIVFFVCVVGLVLQFSRPAPTWRDSRDRSSVRR